MPHDVRMQSEKTYAGRKCLLGEIVLVGEGKGKNFHIHVSFCSEFDEQGDPVFLPLDAGNEAVPFREIEFVDNPASLRHETWTFRG
jgi:hypothetical protein